MAPAGRRQKGEGHGLGLGAGHPADEVDAGQDVAPLVVAAHLESALAGPVKVQEIVGLQQLVVEFDEGQTLFHAHFIGLGGQHAIDAEVAADVAQEAHIVQLQEPVGVVEDQGSLAVEIQVAVELGLDRDAEAADGLLGEDRPHLGLSAGVADHGRARADEGDGPVPGPAQVGHGHDGDQAPGVQAGGRAVVADIEGDPALAEHLPHGLFVGHLGDESAGLQFVEHVLVHGRLFSWIFGAGTLSRVILPHSRVAA